jgi:hypothetical protein
MQQIYDRLPETDMLVLASPIYYHNLSGQLKCAIDRFYSALYPTAPARLRKAAMFLASGDADMDVGARFSFEGDFLGYLGLENLGLYLNATAGANARFLHAYRQQVAAHPLHAPHWQQLGTNAGVRSNLARLLQVGQQELRERLQASGTNVVRPQSIAAIRSDLNDASAARSRDCFSASEMSIALIDAFAFSNCTLFEIALYPP